MDLFTKEKLDSFIVELKTNSGTAFEDEVVKLFITNYDDFQPTTAITKGDGGTDGLYKNRTISLCCYGLREVELQKGKAEKIKAIKRKFTKDFMRLLELKSEGKGVKKKYIHKENDTIKGILGSNKKIKHIKLICNWNEDDKLIGDLNAILLELKQSSACNFVDAECECSYLGPKEVVYLCNPSKEHYTKLRYPSVFNTIENLNELVTQTPTNINSSGLDLKFDDLILRFGNNVDSKISKIKTMKDKVEEEWVEEIVFKLNLESLSPNVSSAIDAIKKEVIEGLDRDLSFLNNPSLPQAQIKECKQEINLKICKLYPTWDDKIVKKMSEIIVSSLIGECPLDWRESG